MKTWLKVTLGIIGFFILIGTFGAIFSPSETNYQTGSVIDSGEPKQENTEPLTILNHEMTYGEYGNLIIKGIAENTARRQLSYAEIRVKFYDKNDLLIDTSLDNINDLNAGEKWKFEVMYLGMDDSEVDRYDIAIGTIW